MKKRLFISSALSICIACFYTLLFSFGFFHTWQERAADTYFLPRDTDNRVVIIAIDDKSIQALGRWPWEREIHANLLNRIQNIPSVIGYDVSFSEQGNATSDARLAEAFSNIERIVIPVEARSLSFNEDTVIAKGTLFSIPILRNNAYSGIVNTVPDSDNITRHVPVDIYSEEGASMDIFAVQVVNQYFKEQNIQSGNVRDSIPLRSGLMRINFVGKPDTFKMYSFIDVYNGTIPVEEFRNKIVLVGATAPNLHDTQLTPVSAGQPMDGVEVHANVIQTILDRNYLSEEPASSTITAIWLLSIGCSILLAIVGIFPGTVLICIFIIIYTLYSFMSFDIGIIRNIIYPFFVLITIFIAQVIYKYAIEYNHRRYLRKAFSYYVSPSVLEEIIANPGRLGLGGIRKEMTVLFADIAGFTSISEKMPPEQLAQMLNYYLTKLSSVIFDNNGVIDKFIGDAIMAFWNAPFSDKDHALKACRAAYEMRVVTREIRKEWEDQDIPDFHIRIGINTGEMVVGNMGSDMRFNYTVIGDNVNLASRLEGINKTYGTRIIISHTTYELVKDEVVARPIDMVVVKGKKKGVRIYELMRLGKPNHEEAEFLETFETARKEYEQGNFKKALTLFEAAKEKHPQDSLNKVYIERCKEFIEEPPENWDGIYYSNSK